MQNTTVALLGDLVQDINLIANPLPVSLTFQTIPPTVYKPVDGGIAYLRKIVGSLPLLDAVAPQLSGKSFEQAAIKIYQTWKRFPETLDSERKVWRIERFIGRADPRTRSNNFESLDFVPADILAIEDLGFGFFERCLHRLDAAGTGVSRLEWLARRVNPREIVLKLSSMRHLDAALGQLASLHPVTAVISVKALRERGAAISEGLSWDRTIEDTVGEFQNGLSSRDLAFCKRVVVLFSTEGAAAFEREDHRCRLKQFVYHPSQHEGTFKSRCPGTISGDLAILTAAVIQHLADPCSFPLFVALALAVSAMRDHQARGGITEVKGKKDPVDRFDFEEPISAIAEILSLPIDFKRLEGEWLRSDLEGGQGEAKGEEINQKKRKLAGLLGAFSTTFRHEILYQEEMQQRKDDESNLLCDTTGFGTEYVAAKAFDVVMRGPREALRHVPMAIYGKYLTVDREEIERINSLKKLILSYRESPGDTRPLSIAVFGPPGSGKSFAIKQLAEDLRFDKRAIHEFNLSQFQGLEALHTAFHLVRDASIKGNLPLIFWDEFDSDKFSWLRYFLAPMQDAEFRVGSVSHPFGKAIFIFAGGVKESFQELDATKTESDMKERKLPDFISRLRGFVNIKGPNRSECVKPEKGSDQQPATTACEDSYDEYLIRRAILLRSILERTRSHLISPARTALISPPLVTAFLRTKRYHHGARSLEALVAMSNLAKAPVFSESCLPSEDLMHLHLDVADFKSNLRENSLRMHEIEIIAEACHSAWCAEKSAQGYAYGKERQDLGPYKTHPLLKHYSELDEMGKEGNRLTARLTLAKLHQAGLKLIRATPGPGGDQAPDASHAGCRQAPADLDRETMACIEHDIWLRDHLMGGYTFCEKTDDDLRLHRNVAKFEALNNTDRRLDLVIVESLESALKVRGYTLSKNQVG